MDAIFSLAGVPRARVLERVAARVPGCLYLCLWAPVTGQPSSSHLFCLDAWIGGGSDRARATFEAYRGALCAVVSGYVPGWAYKEGRGYMELPGPDLAASASLQVQQQFYHDAGTKMAVFMGCESGEIEVGLSTTSVAAAAVADRVQQSLLEELLQLPPARPSSSSSSVPSLSVGSPEYSSLIRAMATPVPGLLAPVFGRKEYEFPTAEAAYDAAMAQAMLALISSSDASTSYTPPPSHSAPSWLARQRSSPRRTTAFKAYSSATRAPRARSPPGAPGQRMVKTCISFLASVHTARRSRELASAHHEDGGAQPRPASTTSQLHHVISERRRRERLNDSFQSLRALLPPGSKKDKANVLASTTEYMAKLLSQVSHLQDQNRELEAQLIGLNRTAAGDDGGSSEKIEVDVVTAGASTTLASRDEVSVRVTVRVGCDISEVLISLLARLKETGSFTVVSVEARQDSAALARASLTLQVTEAGYIVDETSLKEALRKVIEDVTTATPPMAGSPY